MLGRLPYLFPWWSFHFILRLHGLMAQETIMVGFSTYRKISQWLYYRTLKAKCQVQLSILKGRCKEVEVKSTLQLPFSTDVTFIIKMLITAKHSLNNKGS